MHAAATVSGARTGWRLPAEAPDAPDPAGLQPCQWKKVGTPWA